MSNFVVAFAFETNFVFLNKLQHSCWMLVYLMTWFPVMFSRCLQGENSTKLHENDVKQSNEYVHDDNSDSSKTLSPDSVHPTEELNTWRENVGVEVNTQMQVHFNK